MVKGGVVGVLLVLAQVGAIGCGGGGGNTSPGTGGGQVTGQGGAGGTSGSYGWVDRSGAFYSVNAIWGDQPNSLWAVTSGGQLLFYDGATWQFVYGGAMPPLVSVWGLPGQSDIYFVGAQSQFDMVRGTDVFELSAPGVFDNTAVWAARADEVWVGSDAVVGGLASFDLTGTTPAATVDGPSDLSGVRAIWGPAADELWVIDGAGDLIHGVNQTWTRVTTIQNARLTAIHGTARNDVWAVGPYGLWHWDGSFWTEIDQAQNAGFVAVWAARPSEAWIVSDIGWIAHVTPTTFQGTPSGTNLPLYSVWGTSPTNVWVGGQDGLLLHYEPTTGGGQPDAGTGCKARDDECGPGECCAPYNCRRILDVGICG